MADAAEVFRAIVDERGGESNFSVAQLAAADRLSTMLLDPSADPKLALEVERLLPSRIGSDDGAKRIYIAPSGEELSPSVSALWEALCDSMSPQASIEDVEERVIAWRLFWDRPERGGGGHGNFARDLVCTCGCAPCTNVGDEILYKAMQIIAHEVETLRRIADSPAALDSHRRHWSAGRREAFRAMAPYLLEETAPAPPAIDETPVEPPQAQGEHPARHRSTTPR